MTTHPQPNGPPRGDRRRQRTRSAIIGAGQRLFASRAMEGVTIDDIVAEADVAKGSFYNHFDDKEGLASAILDLVHGDCEFHILAANRTIDDPAERVVRALCVMIVYAAEHPDRLQALLGLSERRRDCRVAAQRRYCRGSHRRPRQRALCRRDSGNRPADRHRGDHRCGGSRHRRRIADSARDLVTTIGAALLRALGVAAADAEALAVAAASDLLAKELP